MRYQTASDLRTDLVRLRRDMNIVGASAPVGSSKAISRWRRRYSGLAAIGVILAMLAALVVIYRSRAPAAPASADSLAVVYFENLTDPGDPERLGPMLRSLLITELGSSSGLDVVSSQRVYDIAKQLGAAETLNRSIATEVARRSGVANMVIGGIARAGQRIVVTTELLGVESGRLLASQKAEGQNVGDIFLIAEALGSQVRQDLLRSSSADAKGGPVSATPYGLRRSLQRLRAW